MYNNSLHEIGTEYWNGPEEQYEDRTSVEIDAMNDAWKVTFEKVSTHAKFQIRGRDYGYGRNK